MSPTFRLFDFDPADVGLYIAAEQVSRDYQDFMKNAVIPVISEHHDIKIRELLALICIGSAVRPISSRDLAEVMRQDPATMTRSNVVLIGKGFITTSKSLEDNRVKVLTITDLGQEVFDLYKTTIAQALESYSQHYSLRATEINFAAKANEFILPLRDRAKALAKLSATSKFKLK